MPAVGSAPPGCAPTGGDGGGADQAAVVGRHSAALSSATIGAVVFDMDYPKGLTVLEDFFAGVEDPPPPPEGRLIFFFFFLAGEAVAGVVAGVVPGAAVGSVPGAAPVAGSLGAGVPGRAPGWPGAAPGCATPGWPGDAPGVVGVAPGVAGVAPGAGGGGSSLEVGSFASATAAGGVDAGAGSSP